MSQSLQHLDKIMMQSRFSSLPTLHPQPSIFLKNCIVTIQGSSQTLGDFEKASEVRSPAEGHWFIQSFSFPWVVAEMPGPEYTRAIHGEMGRLASLHHCGHLCREAVPTAAEILDWSLIWAHFTYDLRKKMVSVREHLSGFA